MRLINTSKVILLLAVLVQDHSTSLNRKRTNSLWIWLDALLLHNYNLMKTILLIITKLAHSILQPWFNGCKRRITWTLSWNSSPTSEQPATSPYFPRPSIVSECNCILMEKITKTCGWCPQLRTTKRGCKWLSRTKRNKEWEVGKQSLLSVKACRSNNLLCQVKMIYHSHISSWLIFKLNCLQPLHKGATIRSP